jgi:hypothetical protein
MADWRDNAVQDSALVIEVARLAIPQELASPVEAACTQSSQAPCAAPVLSPTHGAPSVTFPERCKA